jgi:hypothetical protein
LLRPESRDSGFIGTSSGVIRKFEDAFKQLTGFAFASAMTNAIAMLHRAYFAIGVGPGSQVNLAGIYMACHGDTNSAIQRYPSLLSH